MHTSQRYRLLDLSIDLVRQRVERDGLPLDVQGLSFRLLACLLAHGTDVVSFDALIEEVWSPAVVGEETVTQRVKLLRQSLGDDGRQPRYIRSVRGRGYRLCELPLAIADASTARRRKLPWLLAAAVAAAALAGGGWYALRHRSPIPPSPEQELLQRAAYYAGIGQRDNNERAIGLYEQALRLSPGDTAAKLGLSRAYSARVCLYNFPYEWTQRAQAVAESIARTDAGNANAWSALAYAYDCRGRIGPAIAAYERAVALNARDDNSRASLAYLYQEQGRIADALHANLSMHGDGSKVRFREVQIAAELDLLGFHDAAEQRFRRSFELAPDNVFSNIAWPRHLLLQGRFAEAQAALDRALTRNTPHVGLYVLQGELALLGGDRVAAKAAFDAAVALRPQMSLPQTLAALHADTPPSAAWLDRRIAAMQALPPSDGYPSDRLELMLLQWARGQHTQAMDTLTAAVRAGYADRAYLQTSPLFHPMANEPAFAAAIDAISQRLAAQRAQVQAADWRPTGL
ncbi:MAG TPA: winged helix-turn-helix domain-containing protein [Dyella sp.]|uniref:winged helix-turn-helix domain-containing protein n=1 Tax=Dyella sp. TaxID=1869338 RepID=UPI002F91C19F